MHTAQIKTMVNIIFLATAEILVFFIKPYIPTVMFIKNRRRIYKVYLSLVKATYKKTGFSGLKSYSFSKC